MITSDWCRALLSRILASIGSPGWLAFFGSVGGVLLTSFAASWRQSKQLSHESKLANTKRLLEARGVVFLNAVEVFDLGLTYIRQMSDPELSTTEIIRPYLERSGAVAKVRVLASANTSRLVVRLAEKIGGALVSLTVERIDLDRHTALIKGFDGDRPSPKFRELEHARLILQTGYAVSCVEKSAALAVDLQHVIDAMQSDLSLPTDAGLAGEIEAVAREQAVQFRLKMLAVREGHADRQ